MTVTAQSLRISFTEFADAQAYPTDLLAFWIAVAVQQVSTDRWGTMTDIGVSLYTAHHCVLEVRARAEAANGAPPGGQVGPINSKSVDKVSVGYDTTAGTEENGGHWNLTVFGTRYIHLARQMGMGPVQIGAGCGWSDPLSSQNAWGGPWQYNWPNPS